MQALSRREFHKVVGFSVPRRNHPLQDRPESPRRRVSMEVNTPPNARRRHHTNKRLRLLGDLPPMMITNPPAENFSSEHTLSPREQPPVPAALHSTPAARVLPSQK